MASDVKAYLCNVRACKRYEKSVWPLAIPQEYFLVPAASSYSECFYLRWMGC